MPTLMWVLFACFVLFSGLFWLYRRISAAPVSQASDLSWWENFSPERYSPMTRILRAEDFDFLRQQKGFEPGMESVLRRSRVRIFRKYLSEIRADFDRLQVIGKSMVVAGVAGPEMMNKLFEEKLRFDRAYWMLQLQLLTFPYAPKSVDASGLVESFRISASAFELALQAS